MVQSFDLVIWLGCLHECKEYKKKFASPTESEYLAKEHNLGTDSFS